MDANLKELIRNSSSKISVYTTIIEAIVNSIHAIEDKKNNDGKIIITLKRSEQQTLDLGKDNIAEIKDIIIEDNGIGFTNNHMKAFKTMYTDFKKDKGGKGFGRIAFLRNFDRVEVNTTYEDNGKFYKRDFRFSAEKEVENENPFETENNQTKTTVSLCNLQKKIDKEAETIARNLTEGLLVFFIRDDYKCPQIIVKDENHHIILNDYLSGDKEEIQEIHTQPFILEANNNQYNFIAKVFKVLYSKTQSSIFLTAHNREVTKIGLKEYIPEFENDFTEIKDDNTTHNYVIKTYVIGKYLDDNVTIERDGFNFSNQKDLLYDLSKNDIESKASEITKDLLKDEVSSRFEVKKKKIIEYVNNCAFWHKPYLQNIDFKNMAYNLNEQDMEMELQKQKFNKEQEIRKMSADIMKNDKLEDNEKIDNLMKTISDIGKGDLAHYIVLRKTILELFKKSLEIDIDGKYYKEDAVHNIIFPTKSDSDNTFYENHNLWLIDEKLNFTDYISSDRPLARSRDERPDILIYGRKLAFRGGNEASNPITIFEFKRPQRDDFVNPSSQEDPIQQIIRYVNKIKNGDYKTPEGRNINISANTPFYGYVICDLTTKVKDWLYNEKNFKEMPDAQGWFDWIGNLNLYVEVLSWDKVLNDAELRNKIFFKKLGII